MHVITGLRRRGARPGRRAQAQLILLDVMMPEMDGVEVCRPPQGHARHGGHTCHLHHTRADSRENKLEGLNAGAADYITKPIDPR
jgi:DNA-binding response OmpR family regulator